MRESERSPDLSVVIATYRRPIELDRCLAALLEQTHRTFEVVIADDSATRARPRTETTAQIDLWKSKFDARGIRLTCVPVTATQGPAAARNAGWRAAKASIIAFTDDDTVPSPTWLDAGVRHFSDAAIGAVSGRIIVPLGAAPTDYERTIQGLERSPFVTANCLYRRAALEEVGGFDERYTMAWREDTDLWFSVLNAGYECVEAWDAVVVHPVRPAAWGISIREQRKTMFNALLYKKHRALCKEKNMLPRSPRYYAIVLAAALAALSAFGTLSFAPIGHTGKFADIVNVGSKVGPVFWASVWGILTGEFALYRLRGNSRSMRHVLEMIVTSAIIPPLSLYWRVMGALRFRVLYF